MCVCAHVGLPLRVLHLGEGQNLSPSVVCILYLCYRIAGLQRGTNICIDKVVSGLLKKQIQTSTLLLLLKRLTKEGGLFSRLWQVTVHWERLQ